MSVMLQVEYEVVTCYKCGMPFWVPKDFDQQRRDDKGTFYCPHGHSQAYQGKTLRQQLDEAKARAQAELARHDQTRAELETRTRALVAASTQLNKKKLELHKIKKRVGKGVCPCCNQSFVDLHYHMTTVHPEFTAKRGRPQKVK